MTARKCPHCGKTNLRITNVMCSTETVHWHDNACGYREITGYAPDYRVLKTIPPVPPMPQGERKIPATQMNLGGVV